MNVDEIKNTFENMIHLKNTSSYLDEFGGSLFMTILILISFFYVCAYFYIGSKIKGLKENWEQVRCHPAYIPFASLINPDPHMSATDFTQQNFTYCTNNILTSISYYFTLPFTYAISVIINTINIATEDINKIREKFADLINNILHIDNEIMRRILTTMIPIQHMIIKMRDMFRKAVGTLMTGAFTIASGLYIVEALVRNFITLMIGALFIILGIIIPLLLFFFTWPLAIPPIITFGTMAGFLLAVIIILSPIYNIPNTGVPSKPSVPSCFDSQTLVKMNNGEWRYISELKPADILEDNNTVDAVLKLSSENVQMYSYKGLIVSGTHKVYLTWKEFYDMFGYDEFTDKQLNDFEDIETKLYSKFMYSNGIEKEGLWLNVENIPISKKIDYKKEYIYSLVTSEKYISVYSIKRERIIKIHVTDWDEIISRKHIIELQNSMSKYKTMDDLCYYPSLFNTYFETGFGEKSRICMSNGSYKFLKDIQIGDVLLSPNISKITKENKVVAVIKINVKNPIKYHHLDCTINTTFIKYVGTKNIFVNLMKGDSYLLNTNKQKEYYHLLTTEGMFYIDDHIICDYNMGVDYWNHVAE
jgi:hypothetical protein